jgi:hypothetical protein
MEHQKKMNRSQKRPRIRSRRTDVIDQLSIQLAKWFGTTIKFTSYDIRTKTKVTLSQGEIRGAINHMHYAGLILRHGTNSETGYGEWILTTRGMIRASRAENRVRC